MRRILALFVFLITGFLIFDPLYASELKNKKKNEVSSQSNVEKNLYIDMASDHIDVSVGFAGSTIDIFGDRRDKNTDIAIIVEGPERAITVWKKERILGAWVNRYYVKFNKIPVYYGYAVSDISLLESHHELAKKYKIGVDELMETRSIKKSGDSVNVDEFKETLVTKRFDEGNFLEKPNDILFLNDHFFRVSFKIPPSVPTGDYKITTYLIKDFEVVETAEKILKVKQVGMNAYILKSSQKHAVLYSFFCIILAAFSGWVASIVRVRI